MLATKLADYDRLLPDCDVAVLSDYGKGGLAHIATMIERFGLDVSAVALDMTNFATYIDTGNDKADLAQRGKAKQKRADLRLVGLGLVVTRDGGIPLGSLRWRDGRLW